MPQQLFFTKAAALRILPFATKIEALRVLSGSIQVTYRTRNGRCSTFISKQAFYSDFTAFRQEGAKSCTAKLRSDRSYKNYYEVFSTGTQKTYAVELWAGRARCSCRDYEEQHRHLGNAMPGCKHIMASLPFLGHASLAEYALSVETRARKAIARL